MRKGLFDFAAVRPPVIVMPAMSRVAVSAAVAGLALGLFAASHGIWAEARPELQGAVAAGLLAAGAMLAFTNRERPFRAPSGLVSAAALSAAAERQLAAGAPSALILCELTGMALLSRGTVPDDALTAIEQRLAGLLPKDALAARWSEERFLVFLPGPDEQLSALVLAREVAAGLAAAAADVSCHAGVVLAPAHGRQLSDLVPHAELALAAARRNDQPDYGLFSPDLAAEAQRRMSLHRAVKEAVAADSLRLEYQPVHDMRTGALTGFEALMRLHDAELGFIPPSEFIPVAEQSGAIVEIGQWAVEEACRVAAQWPSHLVVAVNLSPAELLSGGIVHHVRRALQRHALPAYRLEVEITEGTLMTESELVLGQLRMLRDMGVGVALDDFGTGYSSLGYLCRFPFSKLKIDRSFAAALDHSASARGVLRAIVKLGHGLGMTVTAEGIETQRQLSLLRDIGCDLAQGYLLGRPAPLADLAAIILRNFAQGLEKRPRRNRRSAA